MAYQFSKSKSRKLQEWIVEQVRAALPSEEISIFSRLKGDIANDVEDALSRICLAVVVSPYIAQEYENRAINIVAQGLVAVSVVENVVNNSLVLDGVEVHADNLLECVVRTLYDKRFEGDIPQFQPVEDMSPENDPVMILVQKIKFQVDF